MAGRLKRCARCNRRMRNPASSGGDWACSIVHLDGNERVGAVTEVWCPDCITTEEHLQREINDSTTSYTQLGGNLISMWPKATA